MDHQTYAIDLGRNLREASDYASLAPELDPDIEYRCHENAYLAKHYFARLGFSEMCLTHGLYHTFCDQPIHHSWIEWRVTEEKIILELDARQLRRRGGYADDEMPDSPLAILTPCVIATTGNIGLLRDFGTLEHVRISNRAVLRYEEHEVGPPPDFCAEKLACLTARLDEHWDEFVRQAREYDDEALS